MKGLVIWAQSDCRSTMGLYESVMAQVGVPVVIVLWFYRKTETYVDNRMEIGFSSKEFSHIPMIPVGENYERGLKVLDDYASYTHVFTVFQNAPVWRRLITEAKSRGTKVVVACESPCNMDKGFRWLLKELYIRLVLKWRAQAVIKASSCFINYSGTDDRYARIIGWPENKIVPFGYYPPRIPNSRCVERVTNRPFTILATGVLAQYRGADVLVEALRILKSRGVEYHAIITQEGELLPLLRSKAAQFNLPIDFVGFVSMRELVRLYESCTVYVAAGRHEPWGMRLNDALQCGAPLVVSRGMGGAKMVEDFGCGLVFENENEFDLALQLERLVTDKDLYLRCVQAALDAVTKISPRHQADVLVAEIERRCQNV